MKYLSATQAGRIIGVNEKTIRLWIAQGKLSAHHASKNRLAIPENEVERIARERQQYTDGEIPGIVELARQVAELRALVEQQQEEIRQLKEQRLATPAADLWSHDTAWSPSSDRLTRPARRQNTPGEPLPPGAILASKFAESHGVNRATFRDHHTSGKHGEVCPVSSRPKAGRPRETEYYVLPEQHQTIFDFWRRHDVPFEIEPRHIEQNETSGDD